MMTHVDNGNFPHDVNATWLHLSIGGISTVRAAALNNTDQRAEKQKKVPNSTFWRKQVADEAAEIMRRTSESVGERRLRVTPAAKRTCRPPV